MEIQNSMNFYHGGMKVCRRFLKWSLSCISIFLIVPLLAACDEYDTFTADRSATLQLSRDEIVFDTLFSTLPSSTQTLIVYNRGDKGIRIAEIRLEGGAASPFRLNVDGQDISRAANKRATDFEVRRRDSIIVRTEVTLPAIGSDEPKEVKDRLVLTLESGIQQSIPLSVVGQDAYFMHNRVLSADTTFTAKRPIVVYGGLTVSKDVTLTMEAGTQVFFHEGAGIVVQGKMLANGTLESPVVLRGDRTDRMFDYLPYDRLPGQWEGITIEPESTGNVLNYLDIHAGNYGIVCQPAEQVSYIPYADNAPLKLLLTNSLIHNVKGDGLVLHDCIAEIANTEISNTSGRCVDVVGGDVTFTHCTLAQFYPLNANRAEALHIANIMDEAYHPLWRSDFINCVITGYADDVVMGQWVESSQLPQDVSEASEEYRFINCFLATEIPTGADYENRFVACVYDNPEGEMAHEKNFSLLDTHAFVYNFMPLPASPICKMADPGYSTGWSKDRRGHDRLSDGTPDAGCYEWSE